MPSEKCRAKREAIRREDEVGDEFEAMAQKSKRRETQR